MQPILAGEEAVPFPPAGLPLTDPRPPPPPPPPLEEPEFEVPQPDVPQPGAPAAEPFGPDFPFD